MRSGKLSRSYASIDYLYNPFLASVQYGAFFKLCRMQAVSFNLETMSGLMFLLFDSLSGGVLGMVSVGNDPPASLEGLVAGFSFFKGNVGSASSYSEVSAPTEGPLAAGSDDYEGMRAFIKAMKSVERESKRISATFKAVREKKLLAAARK